MSGEMPPYAPIRSLRLSEHIIAQIAKLVEDGHLRVNDRFPSERALQQHWQVSRPVLREAFRALEVQGLVESRPGGGRYLRADRIPDPARLRRSRLQASRAELLQIWDAREAVETKAAELAALRATPAQIEALGRPLRLIETLAPEDWRELDFNRDFHLVIGQASGNPLIEEMVAALVARVRAMSVRDLLDAAEWARLQYAHQPIYDAIAARDPAAARQAIVQHYENLRRSVRDADGKVAPGE
ncbi:MAG TPA: FCD domain-containing protein [Roseomonas sp.]|jgi:GntR family transcriptional repressor for pyruvate dehydrogenase complex